MSDTTMDTSMDSGDLGVSKKQTAKVKRSPSKTSSTTSSTTSRKSSSKTSSSPMSPLSGTTSRYAVSSTSPLHGARTHVSGLKMLAHRLSFSKHSLPKQQEKHSNLSQSIKKEKSKPHRPQLRLQTQPAPAPAPAHKVKTAFSPIGDVICSPAEAVEEIPFENTLPTQGGEGLLPDYNPEEVISSDSESESDDKLKREEDPKDYCAGGYHPTFVGEHYGTSNQYLIVRKLGWGHFSTVWLAWDSLHSRHVAIKIVRSSKNYREAAQDEIRILEKVNSGPADHPGKKHIVQLLDHFIHHGPNGEHVCMVFEVLGENMLSLLLRYKQFQKEKTLEIKQRSSQPGASVANSSDTETEAVDPNSSISSAVGGSFSESTDSMEFHMSQLNDLTILRESYGGLPITLVKQISKQILLALDYLHRECGIIHTDLKPENVLVEIHDVERLVKTLELDRKLKKRQTLKHTRTNNAPIRDATAASVATAVAASAAAATASSSSTTTTTVSPAAPRAPKYFHRRQRTPIRASKPLTTPVETSSSVENFFRSFSVGRPRSNTTPVQSIEPTYASMGSNMNGARASSMFQVSPLTRPISLTGSLASGSLITSIANGRTETIAEDEEGREEDDEDEGGGEESESDDEDRSTAGIIDEIIEEGDEYVDANEIPTPPPPPVTVTGSQDDLRAGVPPPAPHIDITCGGAPAPLLNTLKAARNGSSTRSASPRASNGQLRMTRPQPRRESTFSTASSSSILNELGSIISVKIADLGNACWYDLHYTNDIETRQYRAPEVILGAKWGCSTDLWSCACLIFELTTGDYLFDPKTGATYDKNDDHLAQMIELLQTWPPKEYLKKGKYSREFFDKSYQALRHIGKLKIWTMLEVLMEEYHIDEPLARGISNFLLAMLELEPRKRVDAGSMSNNAWLQDAVIGETIDRPFGLRGQDIKGYTSEYHGAETTD
ncbi:DEKNAAC103058 [Brettanomyces naardenensis]|uniref:non-specific serine/threonine protein kinase n=1 Tax=Brettanomyces naardenensis TaxID=13370 RepID=A0A448YMG2_BRENA|nr:DEKNAAC103058 [Brettanomyces naardenensis]